MDLTQKDNIEKARKLFLNKQYSEAAKYFNDEGMLYEYACCLLFQNKLEKAVKILNSINSSSPEVLWAKFLTGVLCKNTKVIPTVFQIRNFLEVDLGLFLDNRLFEYAGELIQASDYLASINPEAYKYYARCLLSRGCYDIAFEFVKLSKKLIYNDPEIHFIEGQCWLAFGEKNKAIKCFKTNLKVCEGYYPALAALKELCNKM